MKGRETKAADPTVLAALQVLLHKWKVCFFSPCGAGSVGKETNTQFRWSYKRGMAVQQRPPSKQNVLAWRIFTRKKLARILWSSRRRVMPRPGLRSTRRPWLHPLCSLLIRFSGHLPPQCHSCPVLFTCALQNCRVCPFKLSVFDVFYKLPSSWSRMRSLAVAESFWAS